MVFFVRFITAICIFTLLGKANAWLYPSTNVILALGYRLLLVLAPLFSRYCKTQAVTVALALVFLGIATFHLTSVPLQVCGAVLVGIGISVSGYLIKAAVAESAAGAANNKIALNAGSLLAGILLIPTFWHKNAFFSTLEFMILISMLIAFFYLRRAKHVVLPLPKQYNRTKFAAWLAMGVAVGIKLFAVFSVLPQYLIHCDGSLPGWYGMMIFLNAGIVIMFQHPIIKLIDKMPGNYPVVVVTIALLFSMILIGFPAHFGISHVINAILWVSALSVIECGASYFDVLSARDGLLFVKEISMGLGAGLTVVCTRYLCYNTSFVMLAVCGVAVVLYASMLSLKTITKLTPHYSKIQSMEIKSCQKF